MNNFSKQLKPFYSGTKLIEKLGVFPNIKTKFKSDEERMLAVLDIYKIYVPNKSTIDIYNRLYLSVMSSLEKKNTIDEIKLLNDNYRSIKNLKRYGIIGGLESFKITGDPGLGKTSAIQRCRDVITGDKTIKVSNPYREIIPVLIVETVADGSFKSLLYQILESVDSKIGTSFLSANKRTTTTIDMLLCAVSNVLINHVGVLILDEIERVANDTKKGETLLNYLTQLVNQANIGVCFVGTLRSDEYFKEKEYLGRRTLGITINRMDFDEYFYSFLKVLFKYQYTICSAQLTGEMARTFYRLSNGVPATVISLFAETQILAIRNGLETITNDLIIQTFKEYFQNLHPFVSDKITRIGSKKQTQTIPKEYKDSEPKNTSCFEIYNQNPKDMNLFLNALAKEVTVEFVNDQINS